MSIMSKNAQWRLTLNVVETEKEEARRIVGKMRCELNRDSLDEALNFSKKNSRAATFLREAGALLECTKSLRRPVDVAPDSRLLIIRILEHLIASSNGAREFVSYGGHRLLLGFLNGESDVLSGAVEGLISGPAGEYTSRAGFPFPFLASSILFEDEVCCRPLQIYNFHPYFADASTAGENASEIWSVLIQHVDIAQESQFTVGFLMWPAALILGRVLRSHCENLLIGRSVHELGAGLGLSGLVAACAASSVVLSDFNPIVVANLNESIELNGLSANCAACNLNWTDFSNTDPRATAPVDLVIASDVVCQDSDAFNLAKVVAVLMKPSGAALIILPVPENRFGTDSFPAALESEGLQWEMHEITKPYLTVDIAEAEYMTWNMFVIWPPPLNGDSASQWRSELLAVIKEAL